MQTSRHAQMATAGARYLISLLLVVLIAFTAGALTGCGGGSGADEALAGQCYVAGQPAEASACTTRASTQPVACAASATGCRS